MIYLQWTDILEGYPMAKNLRSKLPSDDTLIVHDINEAATKKLVSEAPGGQGVTIAGSVREVAEKAVKLPSPLHSRCTRHDEYVLSMI